MRKIWFLIVASLLTFSFLTVEVINEVINDQQIVIFIDPGHGGRDGGAIGRCGTYEKDIVLDIAFILQDYFTDYGIKVLLTRDSDFDLAPPNSKNRKREDIHNRVKIINSSRATLYLSIHANSYPGSSIKGAQTFYQGDDVLSEALAESIQDSLIINMLNTYRHAKSISGIYLVDHVTIPGCLIEVGFLSNHEDLANLKDRTYQEKMAHVIVMGVIDYLRKHNYIE